MTLDINKLPIRSFLPDLDVHHLLSLYSSVEAVDHDGREITQESLLAQIILPGHDPILDRWVMDEPGGSSLIASAHINLPPGTQVANANIIVHPVWRGRGIGSMLLSRLMERAHQIKAGSIQCYASGT